jgi:hypothetical protein
MSSSGPTKSGDIEASVAGVQCAAQVLAGGLTLENLRDLAR